MNIFDSILVTIQIILIFIFFLSIFMLFKVQLGYNAVMVWLGLAHSFILNSIDNNTYSLETQLKLYETISCNKMQDIPWNFDFYGICRDEHLRSMLLNYANEINYDMSVNLGGSYGNQKICN